MTIRQVTCKHKKPFWKILLTKPSLLTFKLVIITLKYFLKFNILVGERISTLFYFYRAATALSLQFLLKKE